MDFERLAEKFGHDLDELKAGKKSTGHVSIGDIHELRDLLADGESGEDRAARAMDMKKRFGDDLDASNRTEQAIMRRAQAYVMADVPMSDADSSTVSNLFPLEATSDYMPKLDVDKVIDLGTSVPPYFLWVGELNILPGGAIRIQNSVLTVKVDTLNIVGGAPPAASGVNYHLGIFGATGAIGAPISAPGPAASGPGGRNANCSVSGSEPGQSSSKGLTGSRGATGTVGNAGEAGKASLTAKITIAAITGGQFVIKTKSGTGGRGGTGGPGQAGGPGGKGGDGIRCECTGVDASNGGKGGTGGRGGTGGTGGRAIAGSDCYVTVPDANRQQIVILKEPAPVGGRGPGGVRGVAGSGGGPGAGDKHASAGATGATGNDATDGLPGSNGPGPEGAPGEIYVNGQPQ